MRQQVAMVLWTESGERQSKAHNGALLALFLCRPVLGGTLQMVNLRPSINWKRCNEKLNALISSR